MENYKKRFAELLAETGALFFADNLTLKDGRPSPYFVNMGAFKTGRLNYELGTLFADMLEHKKLTDGIDVILGPSYKGSAIANATVNALWLKYGKDLLFDYDRKEVKTHGESSGRKNLFVNGCLNEDRRLFIVDDVGTSMNTKYELMEKIENQGRELGVKLEITGIGLGVDREQTTAVHDARGNLVLGEKGNDSIGDFTRKTGVPVMSLCGAGEIVHYLYRQKVPVMINGAFSRLDEQTMSLFLSYKAIYGIEKTME